MDTDGEEIGTDGEEIGTDGEGSDTDGEGSDTDGEGNDPDGGKRDRCVQAVLRESRGTEIVVLPSACSCDSFQTTGQADED